MSRKQSYTIKFKLDAVTLSENTSVNGAARQLQVDQKWIREWRGQKDKLVELLNTNGGKNKKKLAEGGRRIASNELEEFLVEWITEMRFKGFRVSRKMIKNKAKEIFAEVDDGTQETFAASNNWLDRFMERNGFLNRRVTSVAQKDPDEFIHKVANFITFTSKMRQKHSISNQNVIAMDETAIFFDMLSNHTVDQKGTKTITIRSTGHEKSHATVVLAAKGDGTKLKPYVVFKQSIREVKSLENFSGAIVTSTGNGWMNDEKTCHWLNSVVGRISFGKRLLVWDSYRCHISKATKDYLKGFNMVTSVVPGGCTKYIQAPDLSWNKPFKDRVKEFYDAWLAGDVNKAYTKGGNLKAPCKKIIMEWIVAAWNELSPEMIAMSFKQCGVTVALDGSEDKEIHCLKSGQPCHAGFEILMNLRSENDNEIVPFVEEPDDEETENNEIIIYDDEEN